MPARTPVLSNRQDGPELPGRLSAVFPVSSSTSNVTPAPRRTQLEPPSVT